MRLEIGARGVQIPGDYGNHLLLLVNGHVVNGAVERDGVLRPRRGDPDGAFVDHVEIIVGPGSVLYGSNAMLGRHQRRHEEREGLRRVFSLMLPKDPPPRARRERRPCSPSFVELLHA